MNHWLNNGLESEKLVMAMPAYGQTFTLKNKDSNGLNANVVRAGVEADFTKSAGFMSYYEVKSQNYLLIPYFRAVPCNISNSA